MTTQEERISLVERDIENEQEWRRELAHETRDSFARLEAKIDSNHKWTIGLLIGMLLAIITGFLGIIAAIISVLG